MWWPFWGTELGAWMSPGPSLPQAAPSSALFLPQSVRGEPGPPPPTPHPTPTPIQPQRRGWGGPMFPGSPGSPEPGPRPPGGREGGPRWFPGAGRREPGSRGRAGAGAVRLRGAEPGSRSRVTPPRRIQSPRSRQGPEPPRAQGCRRKAPHSPGTPAARRRGADTCWGAAAGGGSAPGAGPMPGGRARRGTRPCRASGAWSRPGCPPPKCRAAGQRAQRRDGRGPRARTPPARPTARPRGPRGKGGSRGRDPGRGTGGAGRSRSSHFLLRPPAPTCGPAARGWERGNARV